MRKDKEKAVSLRKSGKSYKEIMEQISIPKSTLSGWFRGQNWSNDIALKCVEKSRAGSVARLTMLNAIRGGHLEKAYEKAGQEAIEDYEKLKFHPLFISGIMIYWGEGDKTSKYRVSIANTDPQMIKIFRIFLKNICGTNNPKVWLLLYPDLDETVCKEFWVKNCGLEYSDFTKSISIKGKSSVRRIHYGVCNIGVSSAYLKNKILKWIELLAEEISQEKYIAGIV